MAIDGDTSYHSYESFSFNMYLADPSRSPRSSRGSSESCATAPPRRWPHRLHPPRHHRHLLPRRSGMKRFWQKTFYGLEKTRFLTWIIPGRRRRPWRSEGWASRSSPPSSNTRGARGVWRAARSVNLLCAKEVMWFTEPILIWFGLSLYIFPLPGDL